jgi:hypothetical protein
VTRVTPGEVGNSGKIVVMAHDYRAGRTFESLLLRALGRAWQVRGGSAILDSAIREFLPDGGEYGRRLRRDVDETNPPEPQPGIQGPFDGLGSGKTPTTSSSSPKGGFRPQRGSKRPAKPGTAQIDPRSYRSTADLEHSRRDYTDRLLGPMIRLFRGTKV